MNTKITAIISQSRQRAPPEVQLEKELALQLGCWSGLEVLVIPHLYDLAPDGPALRRLQAIEGDMVVLGWLYPRAAYWVLAANRIAGRLGKTSSLPEEDVEEPASHTAAGPGAAARTIWCFDLRAHRPAQLYLEEIARITGVAAPTVPAELAAATAPAQEIAEATRPRWYPVLDFARCTNCLECLNFCLFGVFGLDAEGKITAEQPDACRAGCPACSRICPAAAIMFPQHKDPGIAGDPKASLSGLKLDLSQLFSGGLAELAAAERQRALLRKQQDEAAADRTEPARPPAADELDRLVDEVDDLDL